MRAAERDWAELHGKNDVPIYLSSNARYPELFQVLIKEIDKSYFTCWWPLPARNHSSRDARGLEASVGEALTASGMTTSLTVLDILHPTRLPFALASCSIDTAQT